MVQVVSHWLLTVEASVHSQAILCGYVVDKGYWDIHHPMYFRFLLSLFHQCTILIFLPLTNDTIS
jgi:hypothetical protein